MDQEEMQERQKEEQQNKNKESPVWFVITEHEKEESKIDQKPHIHAYHQNLLFHFLTPPATHITTQIPVQMLERKKKSPPFKKNPPMLQLDNQDLKSKTWSPEKTQLLLRLRLLHLLLMFVFSKIVLAYHQNNNEKI